ncbi:hypothetical protein G9O61_00g002360 [Vairimorpha ceranae]|nr:hypothetical protein G9O61_00g002360 [Vairimorpha ceranae]
MILLAIIFVVMAKRAGTIPFIDDKVILVDSLKNKNNIVLPKGHIKNGESAQDAALRETLEEAGLIGILDTTNVYVLKNVVYWKMNVTKFPDKYDEMNKRLTTNKKKS